MTGGKSSGGHAGRDEPSVVLADPDAVLRRDLRDVLEANRFRVVGEADDATAAVAMVQWRQPDVCLLELDLPGDGLRAIPRLTKGSPATLVVVMTGAERADEVVTALERGAAGFLLKGLSGERLASTLRAALRGEPAVSRAVVSRLVDKIRRLPSRQLALPDGVVRLTPREWEVGELLRDGHSTAEIADRLAVSPVTVRRHVGLLLRKLGVGNREDAVELLRAYGRR